MNAVVPGMERKDKGARSLPLGLTAELTYRCPLACPYCSNPADLAQRTGEMTTEEWISVIDQAADMGILHFHFTGGEPATRRDLPELVAAARGRDLYTNLITSGVGLTRERVKGLADAGLDHLQLSVQGVDAASADAVGGYKGGFERKMAVAGWVTEEGLPLTVNAVMHRHNLDRLEETITLALSLGARRMEVATVQFHGWAERNRDALMPTRAQVDAATATVRAARERLKGRLVIDYVPGDYYATVPKACMGGWGLKTLTITPEGLALPCHAAQSLPHLSFQSVREVPLRDIWLEGPAFQAYRGQEWMREPCTTCAHRERDFGGCRCQALALAGDAAEADPACSRSPHHGAMVALAGAASTSGVTEWRYRPAVGKS
ncbi:MAG: pyrroloquinoline quinone biosynthesis protein PqqE [Rhodospirillum sp.]|nr:pyrroloquinoline quinone biosynthesis protein PqqE [Rhodospirillum sp.]MCF8488898.1 pyrroloquinoline quinone biosynthesis protein PqqE [Rhodospirillum sp.]MCF8500040.1 pyrroloquinoline quinone biosynthesis protein PqqE [Rhodospirillum sp.]